jgi:hypothetical protein
MSTRENKFFKRDGKLTVHFTFRRDSSMLEMEQQIESLLASIGDAASEAEKRSIQAQLLDAIKNESQEG